MAGKTVIRIRQTESELLKEYRLALADVQSELGKIYTKYSVDGSLTYAEMTKYNRLVGLEKEIDGILKVHNKQVFRTIERLPPDVYEDTFFRTAWAFDQGTGVALKWGLLNPDAVKAAVENDLYYLARRGVEDATLVKIRRTITQGLIQGQSFPKMSREIKRTMGGFLYEAERIARTEGMRAFTLGEQAAFKRADVLGVEADQVWIATLDDRTRDSHGDLDGKIRDKEKDGWYVPGLAYVAGPRLSGSAGFDINCRCEIGGEIKGLEPKLRRIRDEGVVPYTTYSEWKENMEKNGGVYKPERVIELKEASDNLARNLERRKGGEEKTEN
jgi:SPP1 gp7 family putative phage head morphogenesis protein